MSAVKLTLAFFIIRKKGRTVVADSDSVVCLTGRRGEKGYEEKIIIYSAMYGNDSKHLPDRMFIKDNIRADRRRFE